MKDFFDLSLTKTQQGRSYWSVLARLGRGRGVVGG